MEDLHIKRTEQTPEIVFKSCGDLKISGRSLPEDPKRFYKPVFEWLDQLSTDQVQLDIQLEYVNTSSSKNIKQLVESIDSNARIKQIVINWYYESNDVDMLEFGQMIDRKLRKSHTEYFVFDE